MPAAETTATAQTCPKCGFALQNVRCTFCGGDETPVRQILGQALIPYVLFTAAGLLGLLLVIYNLYSLLDGNIFFLLGVALFFAPILFNLRFTFGKSLSASDLSVAKKAQVCAGIALWCLLILVYCNGAFDRSFSEMQTTVLSRQVTQGRRGSKNYYLVVTSWRPGKDTEELRVNAAIYEGTVPNSTVTVDVHNGLLGWPWYSDVEIRSFRGTLNTP